MLRVNQAGTVYRGIFTRVSNHTSTSSVHRIIVTPNEHQKGKYVDTAAIEWNHAFGVAGKMFLQFDRLTAPPGEVS